MTIEYVADRRMVSDAGVTTTTGMRGRGPTGPAPLQLRLRRLPSRPPKAFAFCRISARQTGQRNVAFRLSPITAADVRDLALQAISARHGERSTDVIAMQLDYPQPDEAR